MRIIQTEKAPKAVGPYSQAVEHNSFIFCSGQIGLNPLDGKLVIGIENQTHQVMRNIKGILDEAGSDYSKIVKTTIFLTDIKDYAKVNEIYGSYFSTQKPSRSTVQVANLPAGALIEIEVIALK